jgi:hypothetical protein
MRVVQLERPEMGGCIIKVPEEGEINNPVDVVSDELKSMIEDGCSGEKLTITVLDMTEAEYNKLPEWTGW